MPRRRSFTSLTRREIRSLAYLIVASPIIIVVGVAVYFMFSFANWLNTAVGLPNGLTFIFAVISSIVLVIGTPIALIVLYNKEVEKKYRGMKIANIDAMTGIEFEQYLKRVLNNQGYSVSTTSVSGDLGVDLVALGSGNKIAIQAKRHNNKVSRRAISDAVAGMYHYGCNKAMVITNNYFSPGAIELAQSTGCILIDRDTLAKWVNDYQNPQDPNTHITQPTERHNER